MAKNNGNSNRPNVPSFSRPSKPKSAWDKYNAKDFSVQTEKVDAYVNVPLLLNSFSIEYSEQFSNYRVTMRCLNPFTGERPILRTGTKPIVQLLQEWESDDEIEFPIPIKIIQDGERSTKGNQSHRLEDWNEDEYTAWTQSQGF